MPVLSVWVVLLGDVASVERVWGLEFPVLCWGRAPGHEVRGKASLKLKAL